MQQDTKGKASHRSTSRREHGNGLSLGQRRPNEYNSQLQVIRHSSFCPLLTSSVFPEMRAQLRTYHAIPSLQHQDVSSYKQLQDAPRLKSILKGATEDVEQPGTIDDIISAPIPRTNPVNLIFVLAQSAPRISEIHFDVPRDFFDLVMKETLSSASRAKAFLWLMWWYLESDFSLEDALKNPYGPGRYGKETPDEKDMPLRCPPFDTLTEEEAIKENVDTIEELEFGEQKRLEREAINNGQMPAVFSGPKRSKKSMSFHSRLD
jgi:Ino eighty subunit 1